MCSCYNPMAPSATYPPGGAIPGGGGVTEPAVQLNAGYQQLFASQDAPQGLPPVTVTARPFPWWLVILAVALLVTSDRKGRR